MSFAEFINEKTEKKIFVVCAKVFGKNVDEISIPMDKDAADSFAKTLKDQMDKVVEEYRWATEIKVKPYKVDYGMPTEKDKKKKK